MVVPISGMELLLQPVDPEEIEVPGPTSYSDAGDDDMPVDVWKGEISRMSFKDRLEYWHALKEYIFRHRDEPISLFNTQIIEKSGTEYEVVKKRIYGNKERPVLERSKRFTQLGYQIGKVISLQYILNSDHSIQEASKNVPFSVTDLDIRTITRFFDANEVAWVISATGPEFAVRFPLSPSTSYSGMIYFMYSLNTTGQEIPRYIGMSRMLGRDDRSLGSNFANIKRDSVFGRWGYGSGQHLGELSRAIFPDSYEREPKQKYEGWLEALFIDESRVLRAPVYIEMVPFFDESVEEAEEKLIRLASSLFGQVLLNKEYASN